MRINRFEDIVSWQMGRDLHVALSKGFESSRDFSFKDQLLRASLSITNNIAEGFDRGSDKGLKQFLIIARGSCAEVRSTLHIALYGNKITEIRRRALVADALSVSRSLTGFIRKLATSDRRLENNQ